MGIFLNCRDWIPGRCRLSVW